MADTLTTDDVFIPQTVTPPDRPLPQWRGLMQMIANPLRVWPKVMYETPYGGGTWKPFPLVPFSRSFHYFRRPEHMQAMFLDHPDVFVKSPFQRKLLGPAVGEGLLTASGEHWKFQRRAASPAFRIDALRALVPVFSQSAEETVKRMRSAGAKAPIDVMGEMQHATLDVIVETILGGADPNFGYDTMATTVHDYIESMGKPDMLDMFGAPASIWRPWGGRGRAAAEGLRKSAVSAIERRRAGDAKRKDLLGLLLAARDPETSRGLSDIELRDNVVTFIGAGHETTALALTYALYLIANAPDVQERLVREVREVCGEKHIDAGMVEAMTFHEQVVKETMRLYPPVAIIDRMANADLELPDGVKVRKGDLAFALIYVMHRHKLLWDHPERFDPDRFSPERSEKHHRFQYIPFGAGPRICIGMKFAYMEAVAMLGTLVRALKFRPNPAHQVVPNIRITLRPEGGMPLYAEAR
ncbi:MAG TPA: cytochrome P450 [Hyphomonadaceae bacterium]|nr:cytochrome P450 [Hyphomonadaceae bacterium]